MQLYGPGIKNATSKIKHTKNSHSSRYISKLHLPPIQILEIIYTMKHTPNKFIKTTNLIISLGSNINIPSTNIFSYSTAFPIYIYLQMVSHQLGSIPVARFTVTSLAKELSFFHPTKNLVLEMV